MTITVNTRKHLASHQRSPRSRGGWPFDLRRHGELAQGVDYFGEVYQAHQRLIAVLANATTRKLSSFEPMCALATQQRHMPESLCADAEEHHTGSCWATMDGGGAMLQYKIWGKDRRGHLTEQLLGAKRTTPKWGGKPERWGRE